MRKILLIVLLFVASVASAARVASAATVTDSFSSLANWDGGYTGGSGDRDSCQVVSGAVEPITLGSLCVMSWNANTFSGNQTAQVTITTIQGSSSQPAVLVKMSAPTTDSYYRCVARFGDGSAKTRIQKFSGGSIIDSVLENTSGGWSGGDNLSCTAVASGSDMIVRVFKNGTLVLTMTDLAASTPLTGTRVGIACLADDALADCAIDNFTGGDFGIGRVVVVE